MISKFPNDSLKTIIYTGTSMNPTLKTLDILQVMSYNGKRIRRGDIIVFLPPGSDRKSAHRVISVNSQGITTQGDNNSNIDSYILTSDSIVGKVVYAKRGSTQLRIYGGMTGRLFLLTIKATHMVNLKILTFLRPIYRWLARSGLLRCFIPTRMKARVLCFGRPTGKELQLLMGKHIIGRLKPGKNRWQIKRPFRLFLDETSLPKPFTD